MAERRKTTLQFGQGLDRETGVMATQPGSMEDLRNVYLRRGKLVVRKGVESKLQFTDTDGNPITHVLAGQPIRGLRIGLVVGYQGDDTVADAGKVFIYRLDATASVQRRLVFGSDPANPEWFTVSDPANADPPSIITAESFGKAFFAHDTFAQNDREPTLVYDPFTGSDLDTMSADLDVDGTEGKIRFRGVASHLDYLFGWGYGTETDPRPEMLRVSRPGAPTLYDPNHYFIIGSRRDAIVTAAPAGSRLVVLKENELHVVEGSGQHNFGSIKRDSQFGCIGTRLAVSIRGQVLFWSVDGPRASSGGASELIATPLDLKGFEPADLPSVPSIEDGFAEYIPEEQIALWVFGQRAYALNLRGDARGWTYWDLGFTPQCAFTLYGAETGSQSTDPPTGHSDFSADGAREVGHTSAELTFNNVGADGDELIEIWARAVANLAWPEDIIEPEDGGGDGVADGWTSAVTGTAAANFSLDDGDGDGTDDRQQIELTDGAAGDQAYIEKVATGASAGVTYRISAHHLLENPTDLEGRIEVAFLQADDTVLQDTDEVTGLSDTGDGRRGYVEATAPADTAKIRVRLIGHVTGASPSGSVYWKRVLIQDEDASGGWDQLDAVSVALGEQIEQLSGLSHGWYYEFALRHQRSGQYPSSYDNASPPDPDTWPAVSKALAKLSNAVAVVDQVTWDRTAGNVEEAVATWIAASPHPHHFYVDGTKQREIDAQTPGTELETTFQAGSGSGGTDEFSGETRPFFDPKIAHPDGIQLIQADRKSRWMGPVRPEIHQLLPGTDAATVYFYIQGGNPNAGEIPDSELETELEDDVDGFGTTDSTVGAGQESGQVTYPTQSSGDQVCVRARHKLTRFDVVDFSDYSIAKCADVGSGGL